jgi:hypothetical protein
MNVAWLTVLACLSVVAFLLFQRGPAEERRALSHLALLHGVVRIRGESNDSLRNRSTAASRWPYSKPEPEFVWWARAFRQIAAALRRK